jgi:excisionase family DNA binding protein
MGNFISIAPVAKKLGMTTNSVKNLIKAGKLRAFRPGGTNYKFLESDVDAFMMSSVITPQADTVPASAP